MVWFCGPLSGYKIYTFLNSVFLQSVSGEGEVSGGKAQHQQQQEPPQPKKAECPQTTGDPTLIYSSQETTNQPNLQPASSRPTVSYSPSSRPSHSFTPTTRPSTSYSPSNRAAFAETTSVNNANVTKTGYAAALRDLAKNASDPLDSLKLNTGTIPATQALLDVRKGFGKASASNLSNTLPSQIPATFHPSNSSYSLGLSTMGLTLPQPLHTTSTSLMPSGLGDKISWSGFHPFSSRELTRIPTPASYPGYHPALFGTPTGIPSLPSPYGLESDPLYRAQLERYAAAANLVAGRSSVSSLGLAQPSMSPYTAMMAAYNPALIRPSTLGYLPPNQVSTAGMEGMHEKFREEEARRQLKETERHLIGNQRTSTLSSADLHLAMARNNGQQQQKASQASGNDKAPPNLVPSWEGQNPADNGVVLTRDTTTATTARMCGSVKANLIHCDLQLPTKPLDYGGIQQGLRQTPKKIFFIHFQHRMTVVNFYTTILLI